MKTICAVCRFSLLLLALPWLAAAEDFTVTLVMDRGSDVGQSFGSLFEIESEDGSMVIGAGFQNVYNTRYRGDRHSVQFYIRPTSGKREFTVQELPRPSDDLTGAYLFGRDDVVYSTYGGLKSWDSRSESWTPARGAGGTNETMRVGNGVLVFGDSSVSYNHHEILAAPQVGRYELFFYANGYLCFYHVHRNGKPYRIYEEGEGGFSRLYACPWQPGQKQVNLSNAVTLRLPVVGETTFAWGQLGQQIVTGSNIGGFYIFENDQWKMVLAPKIEESYQLYSTLGFYEHLLMGQYPTGRVFRFDRQQIRDQADWPPVLPGVSRNAREAQTTIIYGGDLMVGVWPWGELWRYNPDSKQWIFRQRMFDHPALSDKITHPYEFENRENDVVNLWGQRVTSLVVNGPHLYVSTSAKAPYLWKPDKFPFLAPSKWKSYGNVYQLTTPGNLAASVRWTTGPTTLAFSLKANVLAIHQDGVLLSRSAITGKMREQLKAIRIPKNIPWGTGIYGRYGGQTIRGQVDR
ncbi:MAG: hypothetical protein VX738_16320 [Planctomycetota bacterium]|nr:hypothetical protein [Planctomycetota bacterium]